MAPSQAGSWSVGKKVAVGFAAVVTLAVVISAVGIYGMRRVVAEEERLAAFRPYLGGAVWHGTATRLSDIYLQLFCDDSKAPRSQDLGYPTDRLAEQGYADMRIGQ